MKRGTQAGIALLATLTLIILMGASCSKTTITNDNDITANQAVKSTIATDKTSYKIGKEIEVNYNITAEIKDGAWLGIVPADTPHGDEEGGDAVDVDYKYLSGSMKGTMEFTVPSGIGDYQFRVYNDDKNEAIELATSATFTVTK